ncbi:MAG: radical SAM protein [Dehalococcoidales bacterium]|nr:radical SAM protein [Dehalococcoidales bacterium]
MVIREIRAKNILSKSQIYDYTINPYVGCTHACAYCYARFMKRFTGHLEPWGRFVDVKVNAVDLLRRVIAKAKPGRVWISGVCDPYQPLERKYRLTRGCLEVLAEHGWTVTIQTKSPLVLRDIDLLRGKPGVEVGMSIATAEENMRKLFEPGAPPVGERIKALGVLHDAGVRTFAMIAPVLPGAEGLPSLLAGKVDRVTIDRLNYHYADWVYKKYHLEASMTDEFFAAKSEELKRAFDSLGIGCRVI